MKIRKQVYDLTLKDFDEHPVWEFCHGEDAEDQDEATVKPYEDPMPIELGGMMVVCRADFTLADGTEMKGYLYPPMATTQFEMGDMGYIQPHIITQKGQVGFWYGMMKPTDDAIAREYDSLEKTSDQVFPIRYKTTVEREGGIVEGIIEGFYNFSTSLFGKRKLVVSK